MTDISRQQLSRNVFQFKVDAQLNSDWEWWLLCLSDVHFDGIKCNRHLLTQHLEQALERNAGVISNGDWFDAMQGKYDPRNCKYELRPEYRNTRYLDTIVDDSAKYLEKYVDNILVLGDGNHETSILRRHETNLNQRLIGQLSPISKHGIFYGQYSGWCFLRFKSVGKSAENHTIKLNYHHGSGLKSATSHDRRAYTHPDADCFLYGHHHDFWMKSLARARVTDMGRIYTDMQYHLASPGYKDYYGDGGSGWANEKAMIPKPNGAWWIRFYYSRKERRVIPEPQMAT